MATADPACSAPRERLPAHPFNNLEVDRDVAARINLQVQEGNLLP